MNSKIDNLRAQRAALDAAISAAKKAERQRARSAHREAVSNVIDRAIRSGLSIAQIEAALASLSAPKPAQTAHETGDVDHV